MVFSPMRLHEDGVDLLDADDLFAVSDGFEHCGDAEISGSAEYALGGADDQRYGVFAEGVVTEADDIELRVKESFHVVGIEALDSDGVGDAALDVLVDGQMQLVHELRLSEKDKVVILGKVLKEKPELSEALHVHEMGVINDRDEHFALMVDLPARLDEEFLALGVATVGFDLERLAEDMQRIGVGVKGSGDGWGDHALGVMVEDGMFNDAFPCAGFSHDDAQSPLLAMDFDCLKNVLLMGQKRGFVCVIERVLFQTEVRTYHDVCSLFDGLLI
jgi:hypothetical protein